MEYIYIVPDQYHELAPKQLNHLYMLFVSDEFVGRKLKEIHTAFEDGEADVVGRAAFAICVVADVKNLQ